MMGLPVIGSLLHFGAYLGNTALEIGIFLSIKVARNPPSRMISRHPELGTLFPDGKIRKILLLREFVAETQTVVVQSETHCHQHVEKPLVSESPGPVDGLVHGIHPLLPQGHRQFVIVISNQALLAPNCLPGLIKGVAGDIHEFKTSEKVAVGAVVLYVLSVFGMRTFVYSAKDKSKFRGKNHIGLAGLESIHRLPFLRKRKDERQMSVGARKSFSGNDRRCSISPAGRQEQQRQCE